MADRKLTLRETLGWTREAPAQALLTLRGDPSVPPSRFDLTSLRVFTPKLALQTWAGQTPLGRRAPIVNLFNHTQTPVAEGWSVRCTQVRDFRGRRLTYDSHNGTDFAVVAGSRVAVSAPGVVVALRNEYNRGGLKVYVDHGGGLLTSYNHLGRALCKVGDRVGRGDIIALSAYSGLDALASFGLVAPHIHYNTALGGVLVDPFAVGDELPLWRSDDGLPRPFAKARVDRDVTPTRFDPAAVAALAADLRDDGRRAALVAQPDLYLRAWGLAIEAMVYPTRFATLDAAAMAFAGCERRQALDLPLRVEDFDGVCFADDVGARRA